MSIKNSKYGVASIAAFMFCAAIFVSSCTKDSNSPGYEYMPDMYRSPSYETYSRNPNFADSSTARKPVAGTITRGPQPYNSIYTNYVPYSYPNTIEGYEAAGAQLKNPVALSPKVLAEGEVLYGKFCVHCHGQEGQGDGKLVQNDKFPPPPSYSVALKDLSEGKMFHTLVYGKNMMGSHASQLTKEERWKIIHYVQKLQKLS